GSPPPLEAQQGEAVPVRALRARVQSQRPSAATLQDVRPGQGGEGRGRGHRRLVDWVARRRVAACRLDVGHVARFASSAVERGVHETGELLVVQPGAAAAAAGGARPPRSACSLPRPSHQRQRAAVPFRTPTPAALRPPPRILPYAVDHLRLAHPVVRVALLGPDDRLDHRHDARRQQRPAPQPACPERHGSRRCGDCGRATSCARSGPSAAAARRTADRAAGHARPRRRRLLRRAVPGLPPADVGVQGGRRAARHTRAGPVAHGQLHQGRGARVRGPAGPHAHTVRRTDVDAGEPGLPVARRQSGAARRRAARGGRVERGRRARRHVQQRLGVRAVQLRRRCRRDGRRVRRVRRRARVEQARGDAGGATARRVLQQGRRRRHHGARSRVPDRAVHLPRLAHQSQARPRRARHAALVAPRTEVLPRLPVPVARAAPARPVGLRSQGDRGALGGRPDPARPVGRHERAADAHGVRAHRRRRRVRARGPELQQRDARREARLPRSRLPGAREELGGPVRVAAVAPAVPAPRPLPPRRATAPLVALVPFGPDLHVARARPAWPRRPRLAGPARARHARRGPREVLASLARDRDSQAGLLHHLPRRPRARRRDQLAAAPVAQRPQHRPAGVRARVEGRERRRVARAQQLGAVPSRHPVPRRRARPPVADAARAVLGRRRPPRRARPPVIVPAPRPVAHPVVPRAQDAGGARADRPVQEPARRPRRVRGPREREPRRPRAHSARARDPALASRRHCPRRRRGLVERDHPLGQGLCARRDGRAALGELAETEHEHGIVGVVVVSRCVVVEVEPLDPAVAADASPGLARRAPRRVRRAAVHALCRRRRRQPRRDVRAGAGARAQARRATRQGHAADDARGVRAALSLSFFPPLSTPLSLSLRHSLASSISARLSASVALIQLALHVPFLS
ncbi:uncharacterized protein RHOBADRAFT_55078, partial [Rhodotorula graminis WP1]